MKIEPLYPPMNELMKVLIRSLDAHECQTDDVVCLHEPPTASRERRKLPFT